MYGIDVVEHRATLATAAPRPTVVGEAGSLHELAGMTRGPAGPTVATVPAYANDEQRRELRDAVTAAGFGQVSLINRPTAVAVAYRELRGLEAPLCLVVELVEGNAELSVLKREEAVYEIMSTDRVDVTALEAAPAAGLESAGWPLAVLGGVLRPKVGGPAAILIVGDRRRCEALAPLLAAALGVPVHTELDPATAATLGAAIVAGHRQVQKPESATSAPAPAPMVRSSRFGCVALIAASSPVLWWMV